MTSMQLIADAKDKSPTPKSDHLEDNINRIITSP